jgi:hypothetical protein
LLWTRSSRLYWSRLIIPRLSVPTASSPSLTWSKCWKPYLLDALYAGGEPPVAGTAGSSPVPSGSEQTSVQLIQYCLWRNNVLITWICERLSHAFLSPPCAIPRAFLQWHECGFQQISHTPNLPWSIAKTLIYRYQYIKEAIIT